MTLQLAIPKEVAADFGVLARLDKGQLGQLAAAIHQLGVVVEVEKFEECVGQVVGATLARAAGRALVTLASIRRSHDASPEELLTALTDNIGARQDALGWSKDSVAQWQANEDELAKVLRLEPLNVLEKSLELSYAFPNLFQQARVLTDVRPVFNEDATAMRAAVITQMLEIAYTADGESRTIRLSVDESDLEQLQDICARAKKKASTAKEQLSATAKIPAIIAGNHGENDAGT